MAAFPILQPSVRELPDYLPARMVNEYVYCPRLFFYEWVEGVFLESVDTLEGSAQHKRVDKPSSKSLPSAGEASAEETIHTRSVMLSSERLRIIAKMDLLEIDSGIVTPVDYKHGKPYELDGELQIWPADRAQLAAQALILRDNGYQCGEGVIFYQSTRQRVSVSFTPGILAEAEAFIRLAWTLAREGSIPPPLFASPKCDGCSLAPICLPDEVTSLLGAPEPDAFQMQLFHAGEAAAPKKPPLREVRRLLAPRDERKAVYLDTQGLRVGRSGDVLQVKEKDKVVQEIRLNEISSINLMGNVQLTTQAIQTLLDAEIPVSYYSKGGWYYGNTMGMGTKNVFLRKRQFRLADEPWFCRALARKLVAGKIRNQRTFLLRNHIEPPAAIVAGMKRMAERAETAETLDELLGLEGNAARLYFGAFQGLLKVEADDPASDPSRPDAAGFTFDWEGRNRRPALDPVNALLSLGYSILSKDLMVACHAVGFDPMIGFYHQPRFGRPALALDLMEPFRPLIVDSAVVNAVNTRMVTLADFLKVGPSVALKPQGRKAFYRAYELRVDTLVTHPLFEYRLTYRRLLEVQARLLAKVLDGEIAEYPVFVTR